MNGFPDVSTLRRKLQTKKRKVIKQDHQPNRSYSEEGMDTETDKMIANFNLAEM